MSIIYQGTIAGIGDKANNINVINPQFDAKIRNFIIGKDCILEGLEIENGMLKAGSCFSHGFVGSIEENINLDKNPAFGDNPIFRPDGRPLDSGQMLPGDITLNENILIPPGYDNYDFSNLEVKFTVGSALPWISNGEKIDYIIVNFENNKVQRITYRTGNNTNWLAFAEGNWTDENFRKITIRESTVVTSFCYNFLKYNSDFYKTNYIYGVFTVHHSEQIDSFYIQMEGIALNENDGSFGADILHEAGTYYLLLYKNGQLQLDKNYPENAVNSDNTSHILEGGTLGANVTGVTEAIDDNSKNVATTEFVMNQIEKDIGYDKLVLGESTNPLFNAFTLERKSKYAVGRVYLIVSGQSYQSGESLYVLPDGWKPKEKITLGNESYMNASTKYGKWTIYIDTNGNVYGEQTSDNTVSTLINLPNFGYKIK